MTAKRPWWLTYECPSWCLRGHHEWDEPPQRVHRSSGFPVALTVWASSEGIDAAESREVEVCIVQHEGDERLWLYVGDGPRGLELTVESAQRLVRAATLRMRTVPGAQHGS